MSDSLQVESAMADKADPAIHDFVRDPSTFLKPRNEAEAKGSTVVSSYNIFPAQQRALPGGIPNEGYFKFVLDYNDMVGERRTFEIKYHGPKEGTNTVRAYNLGYNAGAQTSRRPAFIDIPRSNPKNTLLFTGTLSGCSVIVTALNNSTYRVFHDSREDSSLLYDNVEMAIDYSDYSVSAPFGMACAFMQYRNGQWNLFAQLQVLEAANKRTVVVQRRMELGLHRPYFPLTILKPGSYNPLQARRLFDARRQSNREKLRSHFAAALPTTPIPNSPDKAFRPFEETEISLKNPAVGYSQAIRNKIGEAEDDQYEDGPLQWKNMNLKRLVEPTSRESEKLDFTYLWIRQKEARGFNAVVVTDGHLEERIGSTAGERLIGQELDALFAGDKDFQDGYEKFDKVKIPGFVSSMTSLEMTKLFDKSKNITQIQLGALVHHISIANKKELQRVLVWEQTNKVIEMFQKAGGHTKPMPQDLLLNAVPDEFGGRCYPLVRAMSVALARSNFAVEQLGIKLVALSPSSNVDPKNAVLLRECLKDLHSSYPAAEASTLIGSINLRDAVNKLSAERGSSSIFALNTDTHAMLLGATNRDGVTSYHFYDPNFAIVSFASQQKLIDATIKFFTELKFAGVYGAGGTPLDPIFTLVKLDTHKMARIGFDFGLNVADFSETETLMETVENKAATTN